MRPTDGTLTGTTILGQDGLMSNGSEGVPSLEHQNCSHTIRCSLMSDPRQLLLGKGEGFLHLCSRYCQHIVSLTNRVEY